MYAVQGCVHIQAVPKMQGPHYDVDGRWHVVFVSHTQYSSTCAVGALMNCCRTSVCNKWLLALPCCCAKLSCSSSWPRHQ